MIFKNKLKIINIYKSDKREDDKIVKLKKQVRCKYIKRKTFPLLSKIFLEPVFLNCNLVIYSVGLDNTD